ncbi:unnamed protein product [Danaus chrysippus]|uniref:(African queen) hypothetical protein n=1 Tax=Danaus chrysippus TaxID=151541 RepID=A0A8J2QRJ0_9NEOP|nr:unnamed protein product [Danaus chrysippus]
MVGPRGPADTTRHEVGARPAGALQLISELEKYNYTETAVEMLARPRTVCVCVLDVCVCVCVRVPRPGVTRGRSLAAADRSVTYNIP